MVVTRDSVGAGALDEGAGTGSHQERSARSRAAGPSGREGTAQAREAGGTGAPAQGQSGARQARTQWSAVDTGSEPHPR